MPLYGYVQWRNFLITIERAKLACVTSAQDVGSNFADTSKTNSSRHRIPDVRLSRYAAYLVAMEGDAGKPEIAAAKTYFVVQTRRAETEIVTDWDPERAILDVTPNRTLGVSMARAPEDLVRGNRGRFVRLIKTAERDDQCARLQARGYTLTRIAQELGFRSAGAVSDAIKRARARVPTDGAEELRQREQQHLEHLREKVAEILAAEHPLVQMGRVVPGQTDAEMHLKAMDRAVRIAERLAKLTGIDAPVQVHATGTITYQIVGVDMEQL